MTAPLKDVQEPGNIGIYVRMWIYQAIPHASLGGKVYDHIKPLIPEQIKDVVFLLKAKLDEPVIFVIIRLYKPVMLHRVLGDAGFLQAVVFQIYIIIIVDAIKANDLMPFINQNLCKVEANKTGRTGYENFHAII